MDVRGPEQIVREAAVAAVIDKTLEKVRNGRWARRLQQLNERRRFGRGCLLQLTGDALMDVAGRFDYYLMDDVTKRLEVVTGETNLGVWSDSRSGPEEVIAALERAKTVDPGFGRALEQAE